MPFFIIFVIIPLIEISAFVIIGGKIGLGMTLLITLFTAMLGGWIFRIQGLKTFHSGMENLNKGELPVKELFDGFCLVIAGATLVTPGFVTDTIGFLLLVPAFRNILRVYASKHMNMRAATFHSEYHSAGPRETNTIEGDYEVIDEKDEP